MVLVDTSVWVSHLRQGAIGLEALLQEGRVVCHPFIVGELACGNLNNRVEILVLLQALPQALQQSTKKSYSSSNAMASWEKAWAILICIC